MGLARSSAMVVAVRVLAMFPLLYGADLRRATGLSVEQVLVARLSPATQLPDEIAQDPRVTAHMVQS